MQKREGVNFETVLGNELDILSELRGFADSGKSGSAYDRAREANLAGLAFSGGGIRSAIFNLGVIQALANYGLLSKFDYLSMVSGGGYIGGWLSALLNREAKKLDGKVTEESVEKFQPCLKTHPESSGLGRTAGFRPVEHGSIRYLRRYSNYLSPRLGISGDMLAVVSIFLRNFTLIQLTLISLVASILLFAHLIAVGSSSAQEWLKQESVSPNPAWPFIGMALLLIIAAWSAGRLIRKSRMQPENPGSASRAVIAGVLFPCVLAGWWFSITVTRMPAYNLPNNTWGAWMLAGCLCYGISWLLGKLSVGFGKSKATDASARNPAFFMTPYLAALFSGALFGLLMFAAICYVKKLSGVTLIDVWHAVAFGPPLFLLGLTFVVTVHIGAARRAFSEHDREWLARLGGFALIFSVVWTLIFTLVLYATPFVHWLSGLDLAALATWAGGSGLGVWFARSPVTGGAAGGSRWKEAAAQIAPWLFLSGIGVIVAHFAHIALLEFYNDAGHVSFPASDFVFAAASALQQLHEVSLAKTLYIFLGAGFLFVFFSSRFDINLFSLHALYCNRLARTFLGASRSRDREPNPFTGFDSGDDLMFADLDRQRPIPIINTAINMTGGDDLAWQTRRSGSFAFTPTWAGFETLSSQGTMLGQYRCTKHYAGGLELGTLMAVSGAAASPNMGYHTSAGIAALLTAFNLRLGRWCGNPVRDNAWDKTSPRLAGKPILAELTGTATAFANWINLTDGGHFENLGVYELIRRRCRLIVVTDAGCDPNYQFEDLANLLRKCWVDFGVNIYFDQFDFELMHPEDKSRYCGIHFAVGRVRYRDDKPDTEDGAIVYLKSSMTGDEWPDIRQYADSHKDFPHEPTVDQFFDENQFEAYRHLGYKIAAKMVTVLQLLFKKKLDKELHEVPIADIVNVLLSSPMHPRGTG